MTTDAATTYEIRTTYEQWNQYHWQARSTSHLPSVAAINRKVGRLVWNRDAQAWTGTCEQVESLATELRRLAALYLDTDEPPRGIAGGFQS